MTQIGGNSDGLAKADGVWTEQCHLDLVMEDLSQAVLMRDSKNKAKLEN